MKFESAKDGQDAQDNLGDSREIKKGRKKKGRKKHGRKHASRKK